MFSAKVIEFPPRKNNSQFLNFPLDNSDNKNYTKNKKFGISELTIRNRPLEKRAIFEKLIVV